MMSILVSFFIYTLFLVVSNREGLDRRHADYFEGSDSVTVKGRLRVNFVLWQALFYRILASVIMEGYKIPFHYAPMAASNLVLIPLSIEDLGFCGQCHYRTSRSWFDQKLIFTRFSGVMINFLNIT